MSRINVILTVGKVPMETRDLNAFLRGHHSGPFFIENLTSEEWRASYDFDALRLEWAAATHGLRSKLDTAQLPLVEGSNLKVTLRNLQLLDPNASPRDLAIGEIAERYFGGDRHVLAVIIDHRAYDEVALRMWKKYLPPETIFWVISTSAIPASV